MATKRGKSIAAVMAGLTQSGTAMGLAFVLAAPSSAATITYVGSDINGTKGSWRNTSVDKPLDLDEDDRYGTAGYLMSPNTYTGGTMPAAAYFNTSSQPNRLNPDFGTLEWAYTDWGGAFGDWGESWPHPMDNPVGGGTHTYGGMWGANGSHNDFVRITLTDDKSFRLGIWNDGQGHPPASYQIRQDSVGGASNSYTLTSSLQGSQIDWYFWDITGQTGDVFVVSALDGPGGYSSFGGVTIEAVPEPSTWLLAAGGLGVVAVVCRRRRIARA